jgi:gluconate 2-dehydrogenase gamma chain
MTGRLPRGRPAFSRRELLKRAGLVGAVAAVGPVAIIVPRETKSEAHPHLPAQVDGVQREALETLTVAEANTLEAIAARIIPSDANGAGAVEARAARYIDRALAGALASSREIYRSGLAAVDRYAQMSKGASFVSLSPTDQDAVLGNMETNVAVGFETGAATFFNLVRTHTIQGTFGDPYYGGNANFVGWDLIGYPGVRLAVTETDQRLDRRVTPVRRSAYDYPMFSRKRPARAGLERRDPWRLL